MSAVKKVIVVEEVVRVRSYGRIVDGKEEYQPVKRHGHGSIRSDFRVYSAGPYSDGVLILSHMALVAWLRLGSFTCRTSDLDLLTEFFNE